MRDLSPGQRDFNWNANGLTFRARVTEGDLLAIAIDEDGIEVYSCQTRAAFNGLNGYSARWTSDNSFVLDTGDIGEIHFSRNELGEWSAKNDQQIHWERHPAK